MMRIVIVAGQKGYLALRLVQRLIFEREGEEGEGGGVVEIDMMIHSFAWVPIDLH